MSVIFGVDPKTVYGRVLNYVFSGQLPPGEKLVERQLADKLGVSRVPIRESLTRMVAEGLLVGGSPGQGVHIRTYTPEDVRHLYEYRTLLEGGAARAAAHRATETDLSRLELICEQQRTSPAATESHRWAELDFRFHVALAEASHNERILRPMRGLITESYYFFYLFPMKQGIELAFDSDRTERSQVVVDDHVMLLDVIKRGDADGAEQKASETMRIACEQRVRAMLMEDIG